MKKKSILICGGGTGGHLSPAIALYEECRKAGVPAVVLVGFGDPKETPGRAALLSRLRAMAVRRELARTGVQVRDVAGMGDELPVAGNDLEQGRLRNRRVEVWVY